MYELRIVGPWVPDNCVRSVTIIAGFDLSSTCMVVPGQQSKLPNLRVSAEFARPAYESGDTIHVNPTVSNVGDGDAEGVTSSPRFNEGPAELVIDRFGGGWGELDQFGPGVRIRSGETRVFDIFGTVRNSDAGIVTFVGSVIPHQRQLFREQRRRHRHSGDQDDRPLRRHRLRRQQRKRSAGHR